MESIEQKVGRFAYQGAWADLIPLLADHPQLVNTPSESGGYTPLHQAAWHGADCHVIGALRKLGGDVSARTARRHQTAREIAREKHPGREDLAYLLDESPRLLGQLLRKVYAEHSGLFGDYDGNSLVYDRLLDCLGCDIRPEVGSNVHERFAAAFTAAAGVPLASDVQFTLGPGELSQMSADTAFWRSRIVPLLDDLAMRRFRIPLEPHWATVSDLFDPPPESWGLRGDLFLWLEMRQALSHVALPEYCRDIGNIVSSAYSALVSASLNGETTVFVRRFARGGMSSGYVGTEFWNTHLIPQLEKRWTWLRESWAWSPG